jgi:hypothetical protein
MATNNTYTNIKDILQQFEKQVVQKKHYKKEEVYTQAETRNVISTAITAAIQGVNQFNIVKASSASNTPKGVKWTSGSTTITGELEAVAADRHTIYYVPSYNGTNDSYDEYMSLETGTSTYVWEKIGNTDVNLTNYSIKAETVSYIHFDDTNGGLYYIYANENIATDEKHYLGKAADWRTFLGATDTASNSNAGLATPKMVYSLQEKPISSSSAGVALKGTVGAPTLEVTGGSVADNNGNVVTGGTVYTYVTTNYQPKDADLTAISELKGTSGFLKKTEADTWTLDTSTYLTTDDATDTYLSQTDATDTYLSQTDAATTYLSKTAANSTYLSKTGASSTYLSKTDASSKYLSKTDASSTYLTTEAAGTTYAQRSDAICYMDFSSANGLRYQTVADFGNVNTQAFTTVATANDLKRAVLSISDNDFTEILNAV